MESFLWVLKEIKTEEKEKNMFLYSFLRIEEIVGF